jgi:LacI family transcriptional regulator, repressor for deo operon, udp, cdd, tsx, nupC, and nupG
VDAGRATNGEEVPAPVSVTIEDVARRAEVSVATVSRALRQLPNVAPATRARVLAAAYELDYVVDPHASRLAGAGTTTLGLSVPTLGTWYHATLFAAVERVAALAGYHVRPYTMSGPGGPERFLLDLPFRKDVDGLILADAPNGPDELERVAVAGLPLLTLGVWTPAIPSLRIDDVASARTAADHLTDLGHRRLAFLGASDDDPMRFEAPLHRRRGYLDALRTAGVTVDPDLVVAAGTSIADGAAATHRLLDLRHPPSAVFASSDELAFGALQAARERGLDVPGQLSVVGFDDHPVAIALGLTTIRQDVDALGARAAERLLALLADEATGVAHEIHPTELVVRRTTAPPSTDVPPPPIRP